MSLDPVILFFLLGILARLVRSDLRLPEPLYEALSVYLLLALGLKGGVELARHPLAALLPQTAAVILMGCLLPVVAFALLRRPVGLDRVNAAAIAAHYGSVSVVTFAAGVAWLEARAIAFEPHLALFLAVLEVPGIVVGLLLARGAGAGAALGPLLREVLAGKSVLLLLGGLAIGAVLGPAGLKSTAPLFVDLFKGALCLFMLELGLVTGRQLGQLRHAGARLVAFALVVPLLFGAVGAGVGGLIGLSVGGATLLGTLAASASYIAAPAAMRVALPEADPGLSLPIVLGVSFPFNVIVGLDAYHAFAALLAR
ncbi:MAG: sodium-dependent bicarbonate transport family permease [Burkholderiales bacterium]|nr:sodium-dependent bicarbonate transport family permease [Burkholderiales bacterium]